MILFIIPNRFSNFLSSDSSELEVPPAEGKTVHVCGCCFKQYHKDHEKLEVELFGELIPEDPLCPVSIHWVSKKLAELIGMALVIH